MRVIDRLRPILFVLVLGLAPPHARAQQPPDPAKEFLARQVARLALLDLRFTQSPSPQAYQLAELLLGLAREQTPDDLEILRRQIEAAANAHDDPAVIELSRELLGKDGSDTVVQLRLIIATIAAGARAPDGAQDANARLVEYERYLTGDKAKYFDPSVRSRLALDAALLLRERGDDKGFREKLALATQLDSTHKEAAALAAAVYAERRPDDPVGKLDFLQNLLMADPVDPNVHMSFARELAAAGAFSAASRFQHNAVQILNVLGDPSLQPRADALILQWQARGPQSVVTTLNDELARAKDEAARQIRKLQEAGRPIGNAEKPEDLRLGGALESLYVVANIASGDQTAVNAALLEAAKAGAKTLENLSDPNKRGKMTSEEASRASLELAIRLEMLRLWGSSDIQAVRKDVTQSKGIADAAPDQQQMLEGWLALRSDDAAGAIAKLSPYADREPMAAMGIGLAHEALKHDDQAIAIYQSILRTGPISLPGAWARTRLQALGVKDDAKLASQMEQAAAKVPAWIDDMVANPQRFLELTVRLNNLNPGALDRTTVEVSLRNASPIPLAVGADRPLSSRMLFVPRLDTIQGGPLQLVRAEVVDTDRRLRLMPNERLTVTVWPDSGQTGWMLECLADRTVRILWRIIQGFVPDPNGGFHAGPMCLSTETERVVRTPTPESSLNAADLAKRVATEPVPVMFRLAGTLRADIFQPLMVPGLNDPPGKPFLPGPDEFQPVAQAFANRYATFDPTTRAILVATLPHAGLSPGMAVFDAAARAETDPNIIPIVLVTRVSDAKDPILIAALKSDDPRVKQTAELVSARLKDAKVPFYCRLTAEAFRRGPAQNPGAGGDQGAPPATAAPAAAPPATGAPPPTGPSPSTGASPATAAPGAPK